MKDPSLGEALGEIAQARWVVYRSLAALFLEPTEQRLVMLQDAVPELRRLTEPLSEFESDTTWEALLDVLGDLDVKRKADDIAEEYATLFLVGAGERACPPYASAYLVYTGYETAHIVAGVEAAYREAGFEVVGNDLPDHISTELDFLGVLAHKEAGARAAEAYGLRKRQISFLRTHLLRWLPRFAERLSGVCPDGFYHRPAQAAVSAARRDEELLEVLGI